MINCEPGTIVLYYNRELLCTGMILEAEEKYCKVLDSSGETFAITPARFTLVSALPLSPPTLETLTSFLDRLEHFKPAWSGEQIQARLSELPAPFSFEQACAGLEMNSDLERFFLFQHLKGHPERFLWKKGFLRLRSAAEYLEYIAEQGFEQRRENYLLSLRRWLEELKTSANPSLPDQFRNSLLQELRELLLSREPRDLAKLLREYAAEQTPEQQIHALRLLLQDLKADTDPIAVQYGIPINFAPGLWHTAQSLELSSLSAPEAFSIDAEDTADHDDAISLQHTHGGYSLGVHISDVAAQIPLSSELYEECRQRISSLYLPGECIPLLPPELSEQAFSLNQGTSRPVLSLYVELDASLKISSWQFRREQIRIAQNLHYQQVDSLLAEPPFCDLLQIARKLKNDRQGDQPERKSRYSWYLKVLDSDIVLQRIDNLSPARFIVEELMVLYNRLFAEFAQQNGLPLIFRNITRFLEEEDDADSAVLGSQAYLSTAAQFHPGIGSQAYVHATSPIRRFTDIVNQYQMDALLAKQESRFDRGSLENLIPVIEKRLLLLREIAHRSERYWLLRFLRDKYLHTPLDAVLVRKMHQGYLAELSQWDKRIVLQCEDRPPLQTEVKLVINHVDPDEFSVSGDVIL